MTAALFFDASDVEAYPPEMGAARLLALTPRARLLAQRKGLSAASTLEHYSDFDQARCVAAGRRAVREFDAGAGELAPAVRIVGRQWAWQISNIVQRMALTFPAGELMARGAGGWEQVSRDGAIALLLPRVLDYGAASAHGVDAAAPPLPPLYRALMAFAARRLGGGAPCVVAAGSNRLKLGAREAMESAGIRVGSLGMTGGSWRDYSRLLRNVAAGRATLAVPPLPGRSAAVVAACRVLDELGETFSDEHLRAGWRLYARWRQKSLACLLGASAETPGLLRALGAGAVAAYETNQAVAAGVLAAAKAAGIPGIVINHNSHPQTTSRLAEEVVGFLFAQRTCNELATRAFFWSPQSLQRCNSMRSGAPTVGAGFRAAYPVPATPAGPFRVLHAGNYQNWSDYFPWVAETSDEYLAGIASLAAAAADLPGIELVIRVRPKAEVDADVVRSALAAAPNVKVEATEEEFTVQLARSDLVVGHFSTTLEQALQLGKPVLLWGAARRYCQFPARETPPTPGERAAVYAVREASKLRPMLQAIRDQHAGRALEAAELSGLRFNAQTPAWEALGARIGELCRKPAAAVYP